MDKRGASDDGLKATNDFLSDNKFKPAQTQMKSKVWTYFNPLKALVSSPNCPRGMAGVGKG